MKTRTIVLPTQAQFLTQLREQDGLGYVLHHVISKGREYPDAVSHVTHTLGLDKFEVQEMKNEYDERIYGGAQ